MNIDLPSGRDDVHVYVLSSSESGAGDDHAQFEERYLIVREQPRAHESWAEIVVPDFEGDEDA